MSPHLFPLAARGFKPFTHFCQAISDESMEPTLQQGDLALVDTNDRDLETVSHGIYLIKLNDRLLIKRLQYIADNMLRVLSDHPAYEAFSIRRFKYLKHPAASASWGKWSGLDANYTEPCTGCLYFW